MVIILEVVKLELYFFVCDVVYGVYVFLKEVKFYINIEW